MFMVFVLGLLGILQMSLIPGLMLYRILPDYKVRNAWLNLPLILALSFLANYVGVFILTSLHYYVPIVVRTIFVLELLSLFWLYPKFWQLPFMPTHIFLRRNLSPEPRLQAYTQFWLALLWIALIIAFGLWVYSWGNVFGVRDPAVSYNIWAISWAKNQFPILTWHYPQLMPANWSIPYVMIGSLPDQQVLEMFPAALNVVYPLLFLLMFLQLFYVERNRAYAIAGLILSLFLLSAWIYLRNGYADWPCAYLNFLALSLIYQYRTASAFKLSWRMLFIILLVIAAAALIKPAGLYSALLLPWLLVFFGEKQPKNSRAYLSLLACYLILIILIAPWYIYARTHETIAENHHADLVFLIWGIFRANGWALFFSEMLRFSWIEIGFILATFVFRDTLPRFWRSIFYAYLPYFIMWALFFSYDERNLALFIPILATGIGLIISVTRLDQELVAWFKYYYWKLNRLWILGLLLLAALGASCFYNNYRFNNLIRHQIVTKNLIYNFHPGVVRLENYTICPGFQGKILDPMLIFNTIPMLAPHIIDLPPTTYGADMLPQVFNDPHLLAQSFKNYPDIRYFVIDERFSRLTVAPAVQKLLTAWVNSGQITKVFDIGGIALYQIKVPLAKLKF